MEWRAVGRPHARVSTKITCPRGAHHSRARPLPPLPPIDVLQPEAWEHPLTLRVHPYFYLLGGRREEKGEGFAEDEILSGLDGGKEIRRLNVRDGQEGWEGG